MNINEKILLLRKKEETIFFDDREKNVKVANEIDKILGKKHKNIFSYCIRFGKVKKCVKIKI